MELEPFWELACIGLKRNGWKSIERLWRAIWKLLSLGTRVNICWEGGSAVACVTPKSITWSLFHHQLSELVKGRGMSVTNSQPPSDIVQCIDLVQRRFALMKRENKQCVFKLHVTANYWPFVGYYNAKCYLKSCTVTCEACLWTVPPLRSKFVKRRFELANTA